MSMCLYRHLDVHGGLSCGPLGGRSCGLRSAPNGEGESRRSLPSHASRASWSRCIPRRRGDLACGRLVSRSRTAITKVTPVDRGEAQGPRVADTHASKAPHGLGVQGLYMGGGPTHEYSAVLNEDVGHGNRASYQYRAGSAGQHPHGAHLHLFCAASSSQDHSRFNVLRCHRLIEAGDPEVGRLHRPVECGDISYQVRNFAC